MARIRSIKPEFWDDRKLAKRTSRDARLLYIALWNMADEHARLNGDPRWIRGQVFSYEEDLDDDAVAGMLAELASTGVVTAYEDDGDPYLYLPNLARHQRLEPKVASKLPAPPPQASDQPEPPDPDQPASRADKSAPDADSSEHDADKKSLLYVAGSMEHGAGSMGAARGQDRAAPAPPRDGLCELPRDFAITGALRRWANAEYPGLDLDEETAQFCRHFWAEGRRKKNWVEAWRKWIADSHKRASQRRRYANRQDDEDAKSDRAFARAQERERRNDPDSDSDARPVYPRALPSAAN